jgi:hypothetical protein
VSIDWGIGDSVMGGSLRGRWGEMDERKEVDKIGKCEWM